MWCWARVGAICMHECVCMWPYLSYLLMSAGVGSPARVHGGEWVGEPNNGCEGLLSCFIDDS